MASGGVNEGGPTPGRPLPPEDRIWRHPSEVALDLRRARRRRAGRSVLIGTAGAAAVVALAWLVSRPSTQARVDADLAVVVPVAAPAPSVLAAITWADEASQAARPDTITIRSADGARTIARALVVDSRGHVVTSTRALGDDDELVAVWADEIQPAVVVGRDTLTDISVLRVEGPVPETGATDADPVEAGELLALVNPEGPSESRRVVDAVAAVRSSDGWDLVGVVTLEGSIDQLPPGTPAVDGDGALVGIATTTADHDALVVVPIEVARGVAGEIIRDGHATHPRMGVTARDLMNDDDASASAGAYVTGVDDEGPAATGGVEPGDVIVSVADTPVTGAAEMVVALRTHEPGDTIDVVVERAGREVNCLVELASDLDVEE